MADPCPSFDFGQGVFVPGNFDIDCAKNKCAAAATVAQSVSIKLESVVRAAVNKCSLKCEGALEDCYSCVLGEVNTALGEAAECYKGVIGLLVAEAAGALGDAGAVAELTCPPGYELSDLSIEGVDACTGQPYKINAQICEPKAEQETVQPPQQAALSSLVDSATGVAASGVTEGANETTTKGKIEAILGGTCPNTFGVTGATIDNTPKLNGPGQPGDIPALDPLSINWNDPDLCAALKAADAGGGAKSSSETFQEWFADELDRIGKEANANIAKLEGWLPSFASIPINSVVTIFAGIGLLVTGFMRTLAQKSQEFAGCPGGVGARIAARKQSLAFMSKWLGFDTSKADESADQAINYLCPVRLPSQAEANAAWLSNEISSEQWECFTKANNNVPWPQHLVVAAQRTRVSGHELSLLKRRGEISEEEFAAGMRENGYINAFDVSTTFDLTAFWPGASDLIRFMVRDVFDEQVVGRFQYDAEFAEKFAGSERAQKIAQGLGMTADDAKLYWRAHWDVPSNTQVYEMLHRLRPDHPDPEVRRVATTMDDARQVLAINDTLPFWRDRLLAISYRPLTRVDTQRAYFIGAINLAAVKSSYMDLGYTAERAEVLAEFTQRLKAIRSQNEPETKAAAAGAMSFAVMKDRLRQRGYDESQLTHAENYARNQAELRTKQLCLGAAKKRYMVGLISDAEAQAAVMATAGDPEQGFKVMEGWKCEKAARGKVLTASQLCKSFTNGLLPAAEYAAALVRLGYSTRDAGMIARNCDVARLDKLAKAAKRQQGEIVAANEKQRKAMEKQANDVRRAAEKAEREARKEKLRQDKLDARIAGIAAAMADKFGVGETEAGKQVQRHYQAALGGGTFSQEAAMDLINTAAKTFEGTTPQEFDAHAREVIGASRRLV